MTQEVGYVTSKEGPLKYEEYPIGSMFMFIPYHVRLNVNTSLFLLVNMIHIQVLIIFSVFFRLVPLLPCILCIIFILGRRS